MPSLRTKQSIFVRKVALLIERAYFLGFELTFGETYRSPEEAKRLSSLGKGIKNSLHTQRLAIDLNLFINGHYCTDSNDYTILGTYWESLSQPDIKCCWGGRFKKPDGNHFSIEHLGVK